MRILVVRLSAIGDTCHALAVVRNLADNWPDASISWIIGKTESTLMADIPGVEFITFDKSRGVRAYADMHRLLRKRKFDVALCMHASARVNPLYMMVRSPQKIGFDRDRARDLQWLFTNRRIEATHGKHALDAMMSFARKIGAHATPLRWDIPISESERAFATRFRAKDRPLVVISPCSSQRSRNYRNWSVDNFRKTVAHIRNRHDGVVVLTGGNAELEREYARMISTAQKDVADLSGKTSLKQLLALLEIADAVICPDSGPAHMATAVGTPVIGLYASSNPERTGPYFSQHYTVNRYPDSVAKFLGKSVDKVQWGERVRSPDAMDLIRIDDVTAKIDQILEK